MFAGYSYGCGDVRCFCTVVPSSPPVKQSPDEDEVPTTDPEPTPAMEPEPATMSFMVIISVPRPETTTKSIQETVIVAQSIPQTRSPALAH